MVDEDIQCVASETVALTTFVDCSHVADLNSLLVSGAFAATSGEEYAQARVEFANAPSALTELAPQAPPGLSPRTMECPWSYPTVPPPPTRLWKIPEHLPTESPEVVLEIRASTESRQPSAPQAQGQPTGPAPGMLQSSPWPQPPLLLRQRPPRPPRPPRPVLPPPGLCEARPGLVAVSSDSAAGASTPVTTVTDLVPRIALLTLDDIWRWRGNITCKKVHAWLHQTRERAARQPTESVDLSAHPLWRTYVCSHPKARDIIRDCIVKFEGRFLNSLDPNRFVLRLPAPYGDYRFDFVALRGDGTAARLHPGSKRDADVEVGRYLDWLLPAASMFGAASATTDVWSAGAMRGALLGIAERGVVFPYYSQADVISSHTALVHIMDRVHCHR